MGVRYAAKYKNKVRLLLIENDCLSLFKTVVSELNELEIKFRGNPVNENLISYKATIFNSGNIDIDKNIIHEPLKINLPNGFEWKKVKIIDKSDKLVVNLDVESDYLQFNWDILKENEYFTFDSIIEYKAIEVEEKVEYDDDDFNFDEDIGEKLFSEIKITQRITNLKIVDKEQRPEKPLSISFAIFIAIFMLFWMFGGLYLSIGQKYLPEYNLSHEIVKDSTSMFVQVKAKGANEIVVSDSLGEKLYVENIKNISSDYFTGKVKNQKDKFRLGLFIFGIVISIIITLALVAFSISYFNERVLYKKIKAVVDKY